MTTTLTERADPAGLTDAMGTVKAANKGLSIAHYQTSMLLTGNRAKPLESCPLSSGM